MKKLLYLIPLFIINYLPAAGSVPDTKTAGSMGLLKPSTTTADSTRSWGDKINKDLDIIDSTVTNIINGTISLGGSAVATDTTTIAANLSQRTVVGYNNGSALSGGNITAINVNGTGGSATQSGSTLTVTATAGSGSGGATAGGNTFNVVIGTPGTPGVTYNGTSIATMTNKAYSDFGIGGGSTNTIPFSIFFRPGVYGGDNSTCPAKVMWFTVPVPSGTVYVLENDSQPITTNYGIQDGFTYDGGSKPFTTQMVRMMSKSEIRNFTIIGAQGMANYTSGGAVLSVVKASDVYIHDGQFQEYHGCAGKVYQTECATIRVEDSTSAYVYRVKFSSPASFTSLYEVTFGNVRSKNTHFYDNIFDGVAGIAVSIGSCSNTKIKRNSFIMGAGAQGDGSNYGTITIDGSDEPVATGPSTMTVIDDNFFVWLSSGGGAPGTIIRTRSYAAGTGNGITVTNNQVSSPFRTNWTFYYQDGGTVFNTVLKGNTIDNLQTFYRGDLGGGIGDKYDCMGNTFNGIPICGNSVQEGSSTIRGIIISTTGYQVGASTVQGNFMLEGGTIQVRNGTNQFSIVFATQPEAVGLKIGVLAINGNSVILGGAGDSVGSGSGSGGSDNLGSHVATTTLQMSGQAVIGSSQVLVGVSTGLATIIISSPNASIVWDAIRIDTGAAAPLFDLQYSSLTLAKNTTAYFLGKSLVIGSTISAQTSQGSDNAFYLRAGPLLNGISVSLQNLSPFLFTDNQTTTKMAVLNGSGGIFEWGIANGPVGLFGTMTNHPMSFRINDTEVARFDTIGNLIGAASASPKLLYGYNIYSSSEVLTSSGTAYGGYTSTTGFVGAAATFTFTSISTLTVTSTATLFNAAIIGGTTFFSNAPMIITSPNVGPSLINTGLVVQGGSLTVRGTDGISGAVSASTYTVNGKAIFNTTWTATGYDGYVLRFSSGSIPANTTRTFTASTDFSLTQFGIPICMEIKGGAAPNLPIFLEDTITLTTFQLTNPDITNSQKFSCMVPGKP